MAKYSHGKSKGVSDRKTSGRLTALNQSTAAIKQYDLKGGAGVTPKFRTNTNDYFQSQPLNFPGAPDIPNPPKVHSNEQNLKNLATAFGEINTNLQAFGSDFWNYQKSADLAARKKAEIKAEEEEEEGESSNTKLNKAKNALEQKANNDAEASGSYGVFASMDQRVEREYVVVKAKRDAIDAITNFENDMSERYQDSFFDEDRRDLDSGKIIPLNPASPEFTKLATSYFAEKIPNAQARLELQPKIQAAIYSSRRTLSAEHLKYKDNTAVEGKDNNIGTTILNASTASQETLTGTFPNVGGELTEWTTDQEIDEPGKVVTGLSFTNTYDDFNQKSGVSMKTYNAHTQKDKIFTDVAEQVILVSNDPTEVRKNADVALTLLLNTRIGTAKLVDMVGGEKKLKRYWELAIGEQKNKASLILDRNATNNANQLAETDFGSINQIDANLDTTEVDPILNGDGMRTVKVDGVDYLIPSQGGVNISGVVDKINKLQFGAYDKFSTIQEAQSYIRRLEQLKTGFLDSRTADQRNENYDYLKKTIEKSPDQAVRNKQLINYFYRTKRIDTNQYQLLLPEINVDYELEKRNYNNLVNGSEGSDGLFARADAFISNFYRKKTGKSLKALDQWDKEDRDAYEEAKAKLRRDAANIFKEKIPFADRVEKLNQLLQTTKTDYQDKWKEYKESQTGLGNDGNQVRIGDDNNQGKTTKDKEDKDNKEKIEVPSDYKISAEKRIPDLNKLKTYLSDMREDNKQSFVFQTPRELINSLEGGLDGRGNPQQNSSLVTAARTETLYSSPILAHQLNQIEDLAIVLENKNMDGNSLNVWGWIQGADAIDVDSFPKEPLKIERDGFLILPHENNRIPPGPRALSYTREMPAILGRINKDMSPKEYFINQAKLHNLPLTPKFYERLDRVFPDKRNDQFQFEEVKKNNRIGSSISDQEILIAGDLQPGMLPPINKIKEVPSNLKGQQAAAFDRVWEANTPLTQRQTEFGNALYQAGFTNEEELTTMLAIAMAESHTRSIRNHSSLNDTDESYGVLQINMLDTGATPNLGKWREEKWPWLNGRNNLFDINMNAKAAYDIVKNEPWLNDNKEGLFNAWASYENKLHLPFMDEARKKAKEIILNQSKPRYNKSSTIKGRSNIA